MRIERAAARLLSDLRSLWGTHRRAARGAAVQDPPDAGLVRRTRALAPFLTALASRPAPVLIDLGPVVQSNLTFFAERFEGRVRVEDLNAVVDQHVREGTLQHLPAFLSRCFTEPAGSVDGILCWDIFDYLDHDAALALAGELTRLLRIDGALLGFFTGRPPRDRRYTRFSIVDTGRLRYRPYVGACAGRRVRLDGEIHRLFGALHVSATYLLQSGTREMLFRKPR